ncbi:MAG: Abi-alpha family protein [Solirubrobacterales bacterium]
MRRSDAKPSRAAVEAPRSTLESLPGLARISARAWLRTATWGVETSARVGARLARAAVSPEAANELVDEAAEEFRARARQLLGIVDSEGRVAGAVSGVVGDRFGSRTEEPQSLRERGEQLLQASADVHYEQGTHPAYERILADLAPDEARILRLLAREGPQPSVDVRAGLAFVPGSRLVLQGASMIGAEAGLRFVEQVPAYLNNLNRLGLIWFSRDPVRDRERYQVIEVQPEVIDAIKAAGRFSHVVRRSIHLTPLGEDFCRVSLPLDTAELEAISEHQHPNEA